MGTLFQRIDKGAEQMEFVPSPEQGAPSVPEGVTQKNSDMENEQGDLDNGQPAPMAPNVNPAQNEYSGSCFTKSVAWLAGYCTDSVYSENHHLSGLCKIYSGRLQGSCRHRPARTVRKTDGTEQGENHR